jgi:serine/threonine protein kinase
MVGTPTSEALVELLRKSGLVEQQRLDAYLERRCALGALPSEPKDLAAALIRDGFLTSFQAEELLKGKYRGFILGKYKILERLGSGRNSSVYLCEHRSMRRKVALKILPLVKAEDPSALARFYREGRAAGSLDHANIVRTFDNGQEGDYHFLVMEYVDGCSLDGIVQKHGPMDLNRAAHYIRQAAIGLQHVHQAGLIHRDIKPGNLLLDRRGTVKILDMGLVRFFHDQKDTLTQQYDATAVLGTADYLSPEQALNSHDVDPRTDVYSLGATFYFLLAGRPPFGGKNFRQKLLAHLTKEPTPLRDLRPEVPEGLAAIVAKMMAKDREQRYQSPGVVVTALASWTESPIAPPPAHEMTPLSPAAQNAGSAEAGPMLAATPVVSRSASELSNPLSPEQSSSGSGGSILSVPARSPSGEWDVGSGQQLPADTVNLIAEIDTCSDSLEDLPLDPGSEQTGSARPPLWRRRQLRQLAIFCLVCAVVVGVAVVGRITVGTLFSKSPAPVPTRSTPRPVGHSGEGQKNTSQSSQD